ncbi:Tumor protein 63 [Frankliniella fusca]|uniref:Tumor protein 63 n=1 Tax=Frankliniella fusca TaxID=407009 RepID=A0AAE1LFB7_9NEOP|nr:Tumor protein 63 [Frankliniella fusca]
MSQLSDIMGSDLLEHIMKEEGVPEAACLLEQLEQFPDSSLDTAAPQLMAQIGEQTYPSASATGMLPPTDDYPGLFSFTVSIQESSYLKYSSALQKFFVEPVKMVPVKIMWNIPSNFIKCQNIFVRALLVYSDPNRFQEAVKRCVVHKDRDNPWNAGFEELKDHVIISVNENSKHEINESSGRRSVLVPLQHQEDTKYCLVFYKLMCRTSCSRSDMDVIFTLEDESGNVLGRKKLSVKICMAPERDFKKEVKINMPDPINGKRKRVQPEVYIKKDISEPAQSSSFVVVAASPADAALAKDMLQTFNIYQEKLRGKAPIAKVIDCDNVPQENNVPINPCSLENQI